MARAVRRETPRSASRSRPFPSGRDSLAQQGKYRGLRPVQIGFWTFIAKYVLPMVRSEWSCVFPLRISNSIAFADRDPSIFARGNSRTLVRLFEPRNNARRFRPVACMCFVVVGECAVKWVLLRCKFYRDIITPMGRIWVIKTAVAFCPLFVPGTCAIRDEIISTWLFADPKDRCHDVCFPWIRLRGREVDDFLMRGLSFSVIASV